MLWQMRVDPENKFIKQIIDENNLGQLLHFRRRHCLSTHRWKDFYKRWRIFIENDCFQYLDWYPGAERLIEFINNEFVWSNFGQVCILSSSGGHEYHEKVVSQKETWLRSRNLWYHPFIVSGKKLKQT